MFCKFLKEKYQKLAKYYNEIRTSPNAYNIFDLLNKGEYTSREILLALNLDWDSRKMTNFLKKNPNVKMISGSKPAKFTLSDVTSPTLF